MSPLLTKGPTIRCPTDTTDILDSGRRTYTRCAFVNEKLIVAVRSFIATLHGRALWSTVTRL